MTVLVFLSFFMATVSQAKVVSKSVEYKEGDTVLEGFLAYDDEKTGKLPGVVVVHEWTGLGDYVKDRAKQLAKQGYVAFAADIYGKGVRPNPSEAGKVAGLYKNDRPLLRKRVNAAFNELKKQTRVDDRKIAAIGYCFGGTAVLELARSGANLNGVVSFHGGLASPTPDDAKNIRAKVLVLHGADDPNVPNDEVEDFEEEMREAKVDWQLVKYSQAVHAFTNPAAGNDNSKGAAYNALAAKRSWRAMKDFFQEIFR